MATPQDILTFWFVTTDKALWFNASDAFDAQIRGRFERSALDQAARLKLEQPHDWESTPQDTLALIIMLDQFPRNMYRNTAAAFAWDDLALGVAKRMVDKGWDLKIPQAQRSFIYMPFMHSEALEDQNQCVALVDARLDDENTLHHAKAHRKLIEDFGRFPHRNKELGRKSTDAEIRFLEDGGYAP